MLKSLFRSVPRPTKPLSRPEFIALIAAMMSTVAMATDIMLPALQTMGEDLHVADPNDTQLIISMLFLGFAAGQLIAGPLSDSFGRKPVILLGYIIFFVGCLFAIFADDMTTMLIGRVLQGVGVAGPRIVTMSMVRDGYQGREMARIMSIVMSVFILVPAIAPSVGQGILIFFEWQGIFGAILCLGVGSAIWMTTRQPETLTPENHRRFSLGSVMQGFREVIGNRIAFGYSAAAGMIFGAFVSYLSSAQQVFQNIFGLGELFPLFFGIGALSIGAAGVANSVLVMRLGMRKLTHLGLLGMVGLSALFLAFLAIYGETPPVAVFMIWLLPTFFCVGFQFGNLNALAMAPMGHLAGLAAAMIGCMTTLIAVPFGEFIASRFDGTVEPLVGGFCVMGIAALGIMYWTERMGPLRIAFSPIPPDTH